MNLLEKHFDLAFAAPDGVQKLRELILTLAMQGKLVPQDPKDQPATELLKEIEAEKQRLVKEGKIRQTKLLPEIKPDEVLYELPESWEWVRLGSISIKLTDGSHNPPKDSGDGYPMLSSQNVNLGKIDFLSPSRYVSEEDFHVENKRTNISPGDVLLTIVASLGRPAVVPHDAPKFVLQRSVAVINTPISPDFLCRQLGSPLCIDYYLKHGKGTAQKGIYLGKLSEMLIALPPLAEQHRIVAKIDQLMARCDELEKLRAERNQKRITIHTAALNRLLSSSSSSSLPSSSSSLPRRRESSPLDSRLRGNDTEFSEAWRFITQHFGELYSVKENVGELRKAILQLAVMGKLVPQDPNDEPASELLRAIEVEKQRLVKEGKIKEPKPLPDIKPEEVPYELPQDWEWVRLGEITSKITDGDHQTPPRISEGYRLLSAKNVRDGHLDFDNCDFISEEHYLKSRERCCPEFNDLLIVSVGGTIGRTSLIPEDSFFTLVRSVALIKPLLINSTYLKYSMDSSLLQNSIHARKRGGAQPCLYLSEIEKFLFSLPPLAEQHRIVSKIDQLMALRDQLDHQIDAATSKQTTLLNAVMAQV